MNGIAAIYHRDESPIDPALLERMVDRVDYRGPHGTSLWHEGPLGLAHLALSITPESFHETQPLVSRDKTIRLVADCRIDNRPELIPQLTDALAHEHKDVDDPTTVITDPDVILAAYRKWGLDAPQHLIGDFAYVLWDANHRRLIAVRDPLGVKSLYMMQKGKVVCFASEPIQILEHPLANRKVNLDIVAQWLVHGYHTRETPLFKDVPHVPEAHWVCIEPGKPPRQKEYWHLDPSKKIRYASDDDYAQALREQLARCVEDRLRTTKDVVYTELSGGMDSTSIAALAKQALDKQGKTLRAISFYYPNSPEYNEYDAIKLVAEHIGIDVDFIRDEERYEEKTMPDVPIYENPRLMFTASLSAEELVHFSTHQHDLLLTGLGGDELMWGSLFHYFQRIASRDFSGWHDLKQMQLLFGQNINLKTLTMQYIQLVAPLAYAAIKKHREHKYMRHVFSDKVIKSSKNFYLSPPKHIRKRLKGTDISKQRRFLHLHVAGFSAERLRVSGKVLASRGISPAAPFYDRRFAELALSMPNHVWSQNGYIKWLIRKSMSNHLPQSICWGIQKISFDKRVPKEARYYGVYDRKWNSWMEDQGLFRTDIKVEDYYKHGKNALSSKRHYPRSAEILKGTSLYYWGEKNLAKDRDSSMIFR